MDKGKFGGSCSSLLPKGLGEYDLRGGLSGRRKHWTETHFSPVLTLAMTKEGRQHSLIKT